MSFKSRCIALAGLLSLAAQAQTITVSAAASLGEAMRSVATLFEAAHPGQRVRLNLGASGALVQQLAHGAPVDVLVTADGATMDQAQSSRLIVSGQRRALAVHTLVLVQPATAAPLGALADLAGPKVKRIAIGHTVSVPAGRLAQEALQDAGLWASLHPKVVTAHHVTQVLDYVARGEVDAGVVYASDARRAGGRVRQVLRLPTRAPIVASIAPTTAASQPAVAERFVAFVLTEPAQAALGRFGLERP